MEMKIHAGHIEVAVANLLDYRKNIIVPNIHINFKMECDLLIIDSQNRLTEVEIKISLSDLKADFKKHHKHNHPNISRLIYAFPQEMLENALPLIPNNCGVIVVREHSLYKDIKYLKAFWHRQCKHDKFKKPLTDKEVINLTRLGCMRIWRLKAHNNSTKLKSI